MLMEQLFVEGIGHYSYLLGSDETDEAIVIDGRIFVRLVMVLDKSAVVEIESSVFPTFSRTVLRRVARPRGPLNRRALSASYLAEQPRPLVKLLDQLPLPPLRPSVPGAPVRRSPGMISIARVSGAANTPGVDPKKLTPSQMENAPGSPYLWVHDHWERTPASFSTAFRQAAIDHLSSIRPPGLPPRTSLRPNVQTLLTKLNPASRVKIARSRAGLPINSARKFAASRQPCGRCTSRVAGRSSK